MLNSRVKLWDRPENRSAWATVVVAGIGALGACCVTTGVMIPGSPFVEQGAGAWPITAAIAHTRSQEPTSQFLGILLVYVGVLLLIGAWWEMLRAARQDPPLRLRSLALVLVSWGLPIVVCPPLFSRDVYSYAAQGELVERGLNPYVVGPVRLHAPTFVAHVDPLWLHSTSPYGPAWTRLSAWIVQLSGQNVARSVVGFRIVAVVGVTLLAIAVPALARAVGGNPTTAFVLAVLNPLTLLVLLGGAHNDALVIGLCVVSCALAARGHIGVAIVVCAVATAMKIPAVVLAPFIGWVWWQPLTGKRHPATLALLASFLCIASVAALTAFSGLGWRWVGGIMGSGTVVSWADPTTAVGLAVGHLAHLAGLLDNASSLVPWTRACGLVAAAAISARLLVRSTPASVPRALGWSLLAVVVLGPIVWPWYEAWGIVFLAFAAQRWTLVLVLSLSTIACFADVQSAHLLYSAPPAVTIPAWLCVGGAVTWFIAFRRPQSIFWMAGEGGGSVTTAPLTT